MEIRPFKFLFISLSFFRERMGKRGRKKRRETLTCERNSSWLLLTCPQLGTWPATQACALTRNLTSNLSVRRLALNSLSYTSQDNSSFLFKKIFLKILFIYFLTEGKGGRKRGREKQQCVVASHVPSTGDLTHSPGMCCRLGIELATL